MEVSAYGIIVSSDIPNTAMLEPAGEKQTQSP